MSVLICGRYRLNLQRPVVMGVLNLTADSFSDGGQFIEPSRAYAQAQTMLEAGVDIIDIGAESTRPGASPVSLAEELDRILPVLERLRDCGKPLSVDTYKPEVMRAALAAGADMINDVRALTMPDALDVVQDSRCGLVLMHMLDEPATMQIDPVYNNVVEEIDYFFQQRLKSMLIAGIDHQRIVLDPGFGFGKTLTHNLALLRKLNLFSRQGFPVMAGLSRKFMLGELTSKPVDQRLAASLAAAVLAANQGAALLRVHDVAESIDALKVWAALNEVPWQDNIILDNH
ncbi:MAG: dihydropteroate synthase [Ottowia sp.]|nr:dihydropteroate synthase [Ottowia sp.]